MLHLRPRLRLRLTRDQVQALGYLLVVMGWALVLVLARRLPPDGGSRVVVPFPAPATGGSPVHEQMVEAASGH